MGRAKTYDRTDLVERALDLFWSYGFLGTSTAELVKQLDVNRFSLYAEFGNKQGLFEATLEHYQRLVTQRLSALHEPAAGVDDIVEFLELLAKEATQPGAERGCFLCNTATGRAPHDTDSQQFVEAYVDGVRGAFLNALRGSQSRHELRDGVSCEDQACLLTSTVLGFWVLMRSKVDREMVLGAARAAVQGLNGLRR